MTEPTEVLFLDAAGTLFELAEPVGVTYARIAFQHGVSLEAAAVDHAFRCTWKELPSPLHPEGQAPTDDDRGWWRQLVQASFEKVLGDPLEENIFEPLFATLYDHFGQASAWNLFDEVPKVLETLHGHVRLFVVSNFDRRLHSILHGLGIAKCFEGVILSSEVGASKPHPRMFEAALKASDVPPLRCLHAGDEEKADVLGARAAGIPAMHVKRPETSLREVAEKVLPVAFYRLHGA